MIRLFGGGGGGLPPGVAGDGQVPGGLTVAGSIVAGMTPGGGGAYPDDHVLRGTTEAQGRQPNIDDGDSTLLVTQLGQLAGNFSRTTMVVERTLTLNGFDCTAPPFDVNDTAGVTAPIATFRQGGVTKATVNPAGGIGMFGAAGGAAPRALAQATITAITDANAKTAVQALANTLADMGALTLT